VRNAAIVSVLVVVVGLVALAARALWSDTVELVGTLKAGGVKAGEPSTTYWAMSGGDLVDGTDGSQRGEQVSGSHVVSPGDRVAVATSEQVMLEGDNLVVRLALSGWARSGPAFTYEVYADGELLVVESDLDTVDPLLAYLSPVDAEGYTSWSAATQELTVVVYATYQGCGPTTVAAMLGEPAAQLHPVRCGAHFLTSCPVPRVAGPQMHLVVHTALGTDALLYLDGLGAGTTIYWGDGSTDVAVAGENPHTYPNSNTAYRIVIEGVFEKFGPATLPPQSHEAYAQILVSVDQWDQGTGTTDASYAFAYATHLTTVATPPAGLTTTAGMFYGATTFNGQMCDWDVSHVTDMSSMFELAKAFDQDIGAWDTSQVTTMSNMFRRAEVFNQDISSWNTSRVTTMDMMFNDAFAFNQDLLCWNVALVTDYRTFAVGATLFPSTQHPVWGRPGCPAAAVAAGVSPYGIAVTPDGSRLYVTNYDTAGTVTVIDTSTKAVVKTIPVSVNPRDIAITPDGTRAYVVHQTGVFTVINTTKDEVIGMPMPVISNPTGMAMTPDGSKIYVVNGSVPNMVSIVNTANNGVSSIAGPGAVQLGKIAIANTSPNPTAYMPDVGTTREVSTLDATSGRCCGSISSVPGGALGAVAASPDGTIVYGGAGNTVYVIDTSTDRILTSTITLGGVPNDIAFRPDGTRAYAVHYANNMISVINTSNHTLVGTIPTGAGPRAVVVSPDSRRAYVANTTAGTVSFIDL